MTTRKTGNAQSAMPRVASASARSSVSLTATARGARAVFQGAPGSQATTAAAVQQAAHAAATRAPPGAEAARATRYRTAVPFTSRTCRFPSACTCRSEVREIDTIQWIVKFALCDADADATTGRWVQTSTTAQAEIFRLQTSLDPADATLGLRRRVGSVRNQAGLLIIKSLGAGSPTSGRPRPQVEDEER